MSEKSSHAPGTPSWVDLATPDVEGAKAFYEALFGWDLEDQGEEAGHYHLAFLRGKRVAGLGPAQEGGPPFAYWTTYLAGEDAEAHAQAVRDAGGQVVFGPMEVMDQGTMLIAQDPTGATFGIWQPGSHKGAEIVAEPSAMVWNEVNTRDREAAERFYQALFPYTFDRLEGAPYSVLQLDGQAVGGIMQMGEQFGDAPPHWMAYFEVEDPDAAIRQVSELGGTVLAEPFDTPYGRIGVAQDPQGGAFSVMRSASAG